jgi:hypothetical protein
VFSARGLAGVKVKIVFVGSAVITPVTATGGVPGEVKVKVVVLIVAGLIAMLKVAVTTVLGQTPAAPVGGVSEITVGGVRPGLAPGLQHPALKMSSKNAMQHVG